MKNTMSRLEAKISEIQTKLLAKHREESEKSLENLFLSMLSDAYLVLKENKKDISFRKSFSHSRDHSKIDFARLYEENSEAVQKWLSSRSIDYVKTPSYGSDYYDFLIHYQPEKTPDEFSETIAKIFQNLLEKAKMNEEQERLDKIYEELLEEKTLEMLENCNPRLHLGTWINPNSITIKENFSYERSENLDFDRVYQQNTSLASTLLNNQGIKCFSVEYEKVREYTLIINCKPLV